VFPCQPRDKKPLTEHGLLDASTDEKQIAAWWSQWPDANVATPTAGEVVLDVDGPEGEATLAALVEKQHGALPATMTAKTGKGRHLYYKYSSGTAIRNSAGKLGPGLDVRAEGGYVLLPPSIHANGTAYKWLTRAQPAPLPGWVEKLLAEPARPQATGTDGKIPQGQRNQHLASLAGSMRRRGMSAQAIATALLEENKLRCDPPLAENEVRNIAKSVGRYPAAAAEQPPKENAPQSRALTRCFQDIKPKLLRWLWPQRLLSGKLNLLSGDPGEGKSLTAIDIAARCSLGSEFPDGTKAPLCSTVILSAEDDAADTLCPRLLAAGADLSRIHIIDAVRRFTKDGKSVEGSFSLSNDLDAAEDALISTGARLFIIDPVSAYLGGDDGHTNANVRGLLHPLASLASKLDVGTLLITHLRKSGGAAIARSIDSIAFVAAVRSSWCFGKDPENPERRLFLPVKCNLAKDRGGLAYTIAARDDGTPDGTPFIQWGEVVSNITADRMMSAGADDHRQLPAAQRWLGKFLSDGPRPQKEVEAEGIQKGFSPRTIRRAGDELGVKKGRKGFGKEGVWMWSIPIDGQASHTNLATYETCGENKEDSTDPNTIYGQDLATYEIGHENKGDSTDSNTIDGQDGQVMDVGHLWEKKGEKF
jgi:hypothetical protein